MREAWETAEEGILLFSEGRVRYLNPAAARMLGVDREAVAGAPLLFALRDERLESLATRGGRAEFERGGRVIEVRAYPGRLHLHDRTARVRAERALAEERTVVMHELRTPVAGLLALVEALGTELAPEEEAEIRELILAELGRLARLVEGARWSGTVNPWPIADLKARVDRLLPGARGAVWRTPHRLRLEADGVFQILLNLLDNALKYGQWPVAVVSEAAPGGRLRLEVRDAGPPLPDYDGLFTPGRRDVQAAAHRGSGLGLAIVGRIARGFGGEAYGRRVEEGNAFGVYIPPEGWE